MSLEKREAILDRLFVTLDTMRTDTMIPANERLATVVRNRGKLDNDKLPAGYLLDGDEVTTLTGAGRGRVRMQPVLVTMRPQIFVILKTMQPQNVGIGEALNRFRSQLVHRLAVDATLLALLGAEGDFSYDGMTTDLKTGQELSGQAQFDFSIRHAVNPYATS